MEGSSKRKLRVAVLVYTLTGNTRHVAKKILSAFPADHYECQVCDMVPAMRHKVFEDSNSKSANWDRDETASAAVYDALKTADIVGVGSMVWAGKPAPGCLPFLDELPADHLQGKPCFVFATAGQMTGTTNKYLAHVLTAHGGKVFSEWQLADCPDTWVWCLPSKPFKLLWGTTSINQAVAYGKKLVALLDAWAASGKLDTIVVPTQKLLRMPKAQQDRRAGHLMQRMSFPAITFDPNACIRCGLCAVNCPSNSISLSGSENSKKKGLPVWRDDQCIGCTRCAASCPEGAVRVGSMEHKQYHHYRPEIVVEGDNNWGVWTMRWWIVKSGLWRAYTSPWVRFGACTAAVAVAGFCLRTNF
eukprot:TRINITY_DN4345_c0_g1_i1.p1 TRINITY_DN4345_c0_g1~~TRINITY_DN4345_c0_g1_i1.p1  ORF type:complete len:375 (-),score=72.45 TRINITY_DN4345_c0_g1_i1:1764-2840(-)